jgi:probable F420-dependent oxidoreductase
MKLGLHLPNTGPMAPKVDLVQMARDAEQIGYDTLWVTERLFNPPVLRPESVRVTPRAIDLTAAYFDPIVTLAVVGQATTSIGLGTRVALPPLRSPVLLAKEIGTLAALVGTSRILLGVGAGWMYEEFDAIGLNPRERFERLEEGVALMRQAWMGGFSPFDGRHYRHVAAGYQPVPEHPIPILVGGTSEAALRRVARFGDGWAMRSVRPGPKLRAEVRDMIDGLRRACDAQGRDANEVLLVCGAPVSAPAETFEILAELGISHCALTLDDPRTLTTDAVDAWLGQA